MLSGTDSRQLLQETLPSLSSLQSSRSRSRRSRRRTSEVHHQRKFFFWISLNSPFWIQHFYTTLTLPVIADHGLHFPIPLVLIHSCPFACLF